MFFKGFFLGLTIAAIVGPISLLCIRRTLNAGKLVGFISALGAILADITFGLIVVLGLTAISNFMISNQKFFQIIGGSLLCFIGIKALIAQEMSVTKEKISSSLIKNFFSMYFLALINPLTILLFIGAFTGLRVISASSSYLSGLLFVAGIFIGALLWWIVITIAADYFRKALTQKGLFIINKLSGCIIIGFGLWSYWGFLKVFLAK